MLAGLVVLADLLLLRCLLGERKLSELQTNGALEINKYLTRYNLCTMYEISASPVNGTVVRLEALGESSLPATVSHAKPLGDKAVVGQPCSLLTAALDHHVAQFLSGAAGQHIYGQLQVYPCIQLLSFATLLR